MVQRAWTAEFTELVLGAARDVEIPLRNWTHPPVVTARSLAGGATLTGDVTDTVATFHDVTPGWYELAGDDGDVKITNTARLGDPWPPPSLTRPGVGSDSTLRASSSPASTTSTRSMRGRSATAAPEMQQMAHSSALASVL